MTESNTSQSTRSRPSPDEYYLNIAIAVRERASCLGSKVGAVVVKDNRIIATGYNGTPAGMPNCTDGGCIRCSQRELFSPGTGYDLCICVHAEQNALLYAARFGVSVLEATMYTTMQPCFGCAKEMLQAGISRIVYIHPWAPQPNSEKQYEMIMQRFAAGVVQVEYPDPHRQWALSLRRQAIVGTKVVDETGHEIE